MVFYITSDWTYSTLQLMECVTIGVRGHRESTRARKIEGQPKITSNFKFEWRVDGEEIGIPEGIEENNNEGDASELLMPMDRPAPVVMDVDDDSTESGASVEEEISMENDQDNIDAGGNLVVTDGEDSDDSKSVNEGE